jgi:peptide-N4-(N-acetyl-beta-glucosaminyl)asparagine amidase
MAPEMPRRKPVPPPSGLRPGWERELTERFRQLLSTKRMNTLNNRRLTRTASTASQQSSTGSRPPHQEPLPLRHGSGINPARSATPLDSFPLGAPQQQARIPSLSNIPIMATKYTDRSHQRFRNQLHALSETPLKWENPGLLDEAMRQLPMETLFARATEEENYFKASAASLGSGKKPAWSFQDCLIRAMMKWFKKDFFTFVNVPKCCRCGGNTMPVDNGTGSGIMQMAPNAEEQALSATKVELYHCPRVECGAHTRFARYSDAFVLMRMKKGRAGEWVNTFAMLCRALGARVRWVWVSWDNGDHSWAEVYSEYRKRWVHVDPCEASWDHPEMYCEGKLNNH